MEQSDLGTMFVCMPKLIVDIRIYMKQKTSADNIFRFIFLSILYMREQLRLSGKTVCVYIAYMTSTVPKSHVLTYKLGYNLCNFLLIMDYVTCILCLLVLAADNLCKQFGPRSARQNAGPDLDPNCLTL